MHTFRIIDGARLRSAMYWSGGPLAALVLSGCLGATNAAPPTPSPSVLARPVASPSPGASGITGAAPTPLPPATIDVSPTQVQVDDVTLSLIMEPARRMLAQTVVTTASDPDQAHQAAGATAQAPINAVVLDGLLRLTNNIDPSQPAPDDQPQSIVRHVDVQIRTTDGGYAVPYLSVSMDMLLDGHPTMSNLALVPMVAKESSGSRLYYGNNLKLAQRGTYQVFVRLQSSPVLGKDQPSTVQFNVVVR